MRAIEFLHSKDITFRKVVDFASERFLESLSKEEKETEVKTHFPGSESRLFLMEIKEVPNTRATLHAHEKDEIFFILEGEMHFGNQLCSAGDSISILGGTPYTFTVGGSGCRYLKFTGTTDNSFITKDRYQKNAASTP